MTPAGCTFADLGPALCAIGYAPLPIVPGQKRPAIRRWQEIPISADLVQAWADHEYAAHGVGIRLGDTPPFGDGHIIAVDVDILDPAFSAAVCAHFVETFGEDAPVRIGRAPKTLMVVRASRALSKAQSPAWASPDGQEHKVEILASGQQFVAYGVHPDTGQPYQWLGDDLRATPANLLPEVDADQLLAWLEGLDALRPAGWERRRAATVRRLHQDGDGDPFAHYAPPMDGVTVSVMAEELGRLSPDMAMHEWIKVGMACHHQTGGSPAGWRVWDAWSSAGAKYQGQHETQSKYRGFRCQPGRDPTTWRTVREQLRKLDAVATATPVPPASLRARLLALIDAAPTVEDLRGPVLTAIRIEPESRDPLLRDELAARIRARMATLTGAVPSARSVKQLLRGPVQPVDPAPVTPDHWAAGWCYLREQGKFFSLATKERITHQAFDAAFGRCCGYGMAEGAKRPADVALHELQIPVASNVMYFPAAAPFFAHDGKQYANLYRPESEPEIPDPLSEADQTAVARVRRHLSFLLADPRAEAILLSWMAHNVRHPGKKIRWAPLLKGTQGDGKTALAEMLRSAMGAENVRNVSNKDIHSDFSGWAMGAAVAVVEEVRAIGHSRHDVTDALKPFVTNVTVSVTAKGQDSVTVPNTQNYLLLTNHADALPLDEADRRYFVLFSRFVTSAALAAAVAVEGEGYFDRLFKAIYGHPGALRAWLLEAPMHPEFDPDGRAPDTEAKQQLIRDGRSDMDYALEEVLEEGAPGVGKRWLSSTHVGEAMQARNVLVRKSALHNLLTTNGWQHAKLGKSNFLKWRGRAVRVWCRTEDDAHASAAVIRHYLDQTMVAEFRSDDEEDDGTDW
jgi:hypothetical protein